MARKTLQQRRERDLARERARDQQDTFGFNEEVTTNRIEPIKQDGRVCIRCGRSKRMR